MNQDAIIRRGERAARILGDEDIMSFLEEMRGDILTTLALTEPEHHKERTSLYFQQRGINDLILYLNTYLQSAQQVVKQNENLQEDTLSGNEEMFEM